MLLGLTSVAGDRALSGSDHVITILYIYVSCTSRLTALLACRVRWEAISRSALSLT